MRFLLFAVMLASAGLAGCAAPSDGSSRPVAASAALPTPTDRVSYVRLAGASDLFEIQSSQMALARASRADTRRYAEMLVTHHTQTTQATTEAARAAGLNVPPPMLAALQQRLLNRLRRAEGEDFDRLYFDGQIPAHEAALTLHRNYARSGDTPSLRASAAAAVPLIQQHLDEARRMRNPLERPSRRRADVERVAEGQGI